MSETKHRRRYRKVKPDEKRIIVLAKRSPNMQAEQVTQKMAEMEIQPKILQKVKPERDGKESESDSPSTTATLKTMIVTRSEAALSQSPTVVKETPDGATAVLPVHTIIQEPVPQMSRPATVISSTGLINSTTKKLLMKANTDFLVVGIIGTQGVGKSTILNLLANEQSNYDYYNKIYVEEDGIFPTKLKPHKCTSRSRTESTHMFVTTDRLILLDSPPMLCNSYKKDMVTNEMDDLRNIINFLSVCHLLIVVQDDYLNMNFLRLLQFAELMKPTLENKPFVSDYFPNLLYVKNRAKRQDFDVGEKQQMDSMLKAFFKDSQLRIYMGQTAEQQRLKKGRMPDAERVVNSFLLPDFKGPGATFYHNSLQVIVDELRALVFTTPRNEMHEDSNELTETVWFDLLSKVSQDNQHFFFNTYEEISRKHLDIGSNNSNSSKDMQDMWKD